MLSKLIEGGRRILDQERIIRDSGLFDDAWYIKTYAPSGGDALSHYLKTGAKQGFDPGPRFSTKAYLADNPDVREAGTNPLLHYLRFGRDEGRGIRDVSGQPSGIAEPSLGEAGLARVAEAFDADFYLATNPDLTLNTSAFDHFMTIGWRQGRDPAPWFSVRQYLRTQGDVAQSGQNPFVHFLLKGASEGRAVVVSSSEAPELEKVSDRCLVLSSGRITGLLEGPNLTEDNILACAVAHATIGI